MGHFREGGYDVAHGEAPDFRVSAPGVAFAVEATTVAPSKDGVLSQHPNPKTAEEIAAFLADYMPIKYGNSLTNKLNGVRLPVRPIGRKKELLDCRS